MTQNKRTLLYVFSWFFLLAGCTSDNRHLIGPSDQVTLSSEVDESDKVQFLFFWEKDDSENKQTILVHSKERLLGALREGVYFPAAFCPGEEVIRFEKREKGFHIQDTITNTHYVNWKINKDEPLYVGVSVNENGTIDALIRSEKEATAAVGNIDYHTFLVNRKVDTCQPPVIPEEQPVAPVKLKSIELSADALFAFNSDQLNSRRATKQINSLIEQINSSHLSVTKIVVSGYTDRLGTAPYNQKLSEKRAQTIVDYLIAKGIKSRIESIGYGSEKSVTDSACTNQLSTKALIDCLQPDRRVSVELWGKFQDESTLSETK